MVGTGAGIDCVRRYLLQKHIIYCSHVIMILLLYSYAVDFPLWGWLPRNVDMVTVKGTFAHVQWQIVTNSGSEAWGWRRPYFHNQETLYIRSNITNWSLFRLVVPNLWPWAVIMATMNSFEYLQSLVYLTITKVSSIEIWATWTDGNSIEFRERWFDQI